MKMQDMDNKVFSDILLSYREGALRHANCALTDMDYLGFKAEAEAFEEASRRIAAICEELYGRSPALVALAEQKEKNNADRAGLAEKKPRRKVGSVAKDARRVGGRRKQPAKPKRRSPR